MAKTVARFSYLGHEAAHLEDGRVIRTIGGETSFDAPYQMHLWLRWIGEGCPEFRSVGRHVRAARR